MEIGLCMPDHTDGSCNEVVGALRGLLRWNAQIGPLLGQRVIFGELGGLAGADQPDAGVANMRRQSVPSGDKNRLQGAAHSASFSGEKGRGFEDFVARCAHRLEQEFADFSEVFFRGGLTVLPQNGLTVVDVLLDHIAGQGARDVTTKASAHSICHHKESKAPVQQVRVLVFRTDFADVCSGPGLDAQSLTDGRSPGTDVIELRSMVHLEGT